MTLFYYKNLIIRPKQKATCLLVFTFFYQWIKMGRFWSWRANLAALLISNFFFNNTYSIGFWWRQTKHRSVKSRDGDRGKDRRTGSSEFLQIKREWETTMCAPDGCLSWGDSSTTVSLHLNIRSNGINHQVHNHSGH